MLLISLFCLCSRNNKYQLMEASHMENILIQRRRFSNNIPTHCIKSANLLHCVHGYQESVYHAKICLNYYLQQCVHISERFILNK